MRKLLAACTILMGITLCIALGIARTKGIWP